MKIRYSLNEAQLREDHRIENVKSKAADTFSNIDELIQLMDEIELPSNMEKSIYNRLMDALQTCREIINM